MIDSCYIVIVLSLPIVHAIVIIDYGLELNITINFNRPIIESNSSSL